MQTPVVVHASIAELCASATQRPPLNEVSPLGMLPAMGNSVMVDEGRTVAETVAAPVAPAVESVTVMVTLIVPLPA